MIKKNLKSYVNMNITVTTLGANYLVYAGYFNTISFLSGPSERVLPGGRLKVCTIASYIYYSTF